MCSFDLEQLPKFFYKNKKNVPKKITSSKNKNKLSRPSPKKSKKKKEKREAMLMPKKKKVTTGNVIA